jgi:hypothetical protein
MKRLTLLQLQATTQKPINKVTNDVRTAVSNVCCGIDDMHMFGNKALVLRAEILPKYLQELHKVLGAIGVNITQQDLPEENTLKADVEYPLSIQVTSFSDDTDQKRHIPNVPG